MSTLEREKLWSKHLVKYRHLKNRLSPIIQLITRMPPTEANSGARTSQRWQRGYQLMLMWEKVKSACRQSTRANSTELSRQSTPWHTRCPCGVGPNLTQPSHVRWVKPRNLGYGSGLILIQPEQNLSSCMQVPWAEPTLK